MYKSLSNNNLNAKKIIIGHICYSNYVRFQVNCYLKATYKYTNVQIESYFIFIVKSVQISIILMIDDNFFCTPLSVEW